MRTRNEESAGGVVFRLRDDGGADVIVILTHRRNWQLPKGWIEDGESREATAVREVREETGVDAEVVGELDTIEYWYVSNYEPEPAHVHKHVHFYLLRYTGGSNDDHDDESLEARWVDIDEAVRMLAFAEEKRVMRMARDALTEVLNERR